MKKSVLVTVDQDIWLYYRLKNINLSGHINEILRFQMDLEQDNREEAELQTTLEELHAKRKEIEKEEIKVQAEMLRRKSETEKLHKQEMERAMMVDDTIKNSGQLKEMF